MEDKLDMDIAPEDVPRARYYRTRGGYKVHRGECKHSQVDSAVPWEWAQEVSEDAWTLGPVVYSYGLSPCRACLPHVAKWVDAGMGQAIMFAMLAQRAARVAR